MKRTLLLLVVCLMTSGPVMGEEDFPILPLPKTMAPVQPPAGTASRPLPERPGGKAGEILPMPQERAPGETPTTPTPPTDPDALLPLPPDHGAKPVTGPGNAQEPPLVHEPAALPSQPAVPPPPPEEIALPGEVVINTQQPGPGVPGQPGNQTGSQSPPSAGAALPIFPKDTSSALFMVMKTWECENYDGKTLLGHAIGVYGQEAEDAFKSQGLEQLPDFQVTLKEDDITLDELLDIVAQKSHTDWGVDISQKIIYFYPAPRQ